MAVETFAIGVGAAMLEVGHNVRQLAFDHLGNIDERLELAARRPAVLTIEVLLSRSGLDLSPRTGQDLLDCLRASPETCFPFQGRANHKSRKECEADESQ